MFDLTFSLSELYELRRSQVVYIEWCGQRIKETGQVETYMEKVQQASALTLRIDAILEDYEDAQR